MSPPSAVVSPDKISEAQFNESLGKYAPLIKAISEAKPGKSGLLPAGLVKRHVCRLTTSSPAYTTPTNHMSDAM